MQKKIEENCKMGLTAMNRTTTIRSARGDYHVKAQGHTALLFQCLKMNMQMTDDRRALG